FRDCGLYPENLVPSPYTHELLPRQHRIDVLDGVAAGDAIDLAPPGPLEAELGLDVKRGGIVDEDAGADETDVVGREGMREKRPARLGGVALAPMRAAEPVAELGAR